MNDLHHGASPVQSTAQRNAKVGISVDFQRAKLDRWVFLRCAQKQPEHPFRQQPTGVSVSSLEWISTTNFFFGDWRNAFRGRKSPLRSRETSAMLLNLPDPS